MISKVIKVIGRIIKNQKKEVKAVDNVDKLEGLIGGGQRSGDIILTNENTSKTIKEIDAELEKRKQEESGPVKKRKATPVEYLRLFGRVPRLDQIQQLQPKDFNKEDAEKLLAAGCTKKLLAQFYNISIGSMYYYLQKWGLYPAGGQVAGKAAGQAVEAAGKETVTGDKPALAVKDEPIAALDNELKQDESVESKLTLSVMKRYIPNGFRAAGNPFISISVTGKINLSKSALLSGPDFMREGKFKAGVYVTKDGKVIAIHPEETGFSFCIKKHYKTASGNVRNLPNDLVAAGIRLPARYRAAWDEELQAWVGRLENQEARIS